MTQPLQLNITFLSDWHIGEGAGAYGHVNAIVRRSPQHGLPYLPAKTLTGILRDGCERIAFGLDSGNEQGPWHALLKQIFGNNAEDVDPTLQPAALSIEPAHFEPDLLDALLERPALQEALVFLKPGVQLDAEGVAQDQMLRHEEVVLAGSTLCADMTLSIQKPLEKSALALLSAGSQIVERLGSKRRRGHGRCRLSFVESPEYEELLALLRCPPPVHDQQPVQPKVFTLSKEGIALSGQWQLLALDLRLLAPVVIPNATLGNIVTTRDHIPGSLLLPALNRWLRELLGDQTTSALASGALQIRNAYPAIGERRLLPIPAAIFKLKNEDVFTNHLSFVTSDGRQRKQQRAGFAAHDCLELLPGSAEAETRVGAVLVETMTTTHATIEDARQRPTANVGGVFTYEAIRHSQTSFDTFTAELWIDAQLMSESIKAKLHSWLQACPTQVRIGRAKKDDYGRVSLSCRPLAATPVLPRGKELTVWLTAPMLLRDEALDPVADAIGFASALARTIEALNTTYKGITLTPIQTFARPWRDDGWNNAWQMQRATRFGLAPGSCFQLRSDRDLSAEVLDKLQAAGLGERRAEGYGEIRINPPLLHNSTVPIRSGNGEVTSGASLATQLPVQLEATEFTQALQRRALRLAIRRSIYLRDQSFRRDLKWSKDSPPNSQLGTLRSLMETLSDQSGLQRLGAWLKAMEAKGNERRANKWPAASRRILEQHITKASGIWHSLELTDLESLELSSGDRLSDSLRYEAMRALWLAAISRQLHENQHTSKANSTAEATAHGA